MLTLNNVETQDDYEDAVTLGPMPSAEKVVYLVANASVFAQVAGQSSAKTAQPWGDEILVTPQSAEFQRIQGIRFRSAVPGSPARVIAQLITPDDPIPVGGTPFTLNLSGTGEAAMSTAGQELGYVEGAGPVTFAATTEATATPILTLPPITFDGTQTVLIEYSCIRLQATGSSKAFVALFEDGLTLGTLVHNFGDGVDMFAPVAVARRRIPSAGVHTYAVRGWCSIANQAIAWAGAEAVPGVSGSLLPQFLRITQAV